ncbi:DUF6247 family protein [Bailinhaonella thermotolerans]|uniref:Uncharacterized protein n=1 Tax=Bailinhaonella thermotolerans TaxID=1070861 RepID=A0A3A4AJI1_9ACTN|nr:DUF6247 family protein [Bailinhaonella thermotolerans]RJL21031.1 hypothetical protein D5H75_38100 [Bailinhaonella thermotolerans]
MSVIHRSRADVPSLTPESILSHLPEEYRSGFLVEYHAALKQAYDPTRYDAIDKVLRLWRLQAVALSDPTYRQRMADAERGEPGVPAEDVIPGWANRS